MNKLGARLLSLSRHTAVRNAGLLYLVQVSNYVFPLVTLPYLSHILSPGKLGLLVFAQSFVWYFYTLTEYGFDLTATRQVAINKDDPEALSRIFSSIMTAKVLLTALGFVIMLAVVFFAPRLRDNWPLFVISFLTVIGGLLFPMWLYQGVEKMGVVAARDFAAKLLATALIFLVVRHEKDYLWAAAFQSGAMAIAGLVSLLAAPGICKVRFHPPAWGEVIGALREGWSVFLSMAALSLMGSTNIVILGFIASDADLGYFAAAYRLIAALRGLAIPIVTAIYPRISHMAARSAGDAIAFLKRYALIIALPFLAGSLALFIGAPLAVRIVLGKQFQPTVPLLRIMAFSPFLLTLAHVYSTYFMLAFGYSKQWSRIIIQTTVLNYLLMGLFLFMFRPAVAMAVTATGLDLFSVAASYLFYRRTSGSLIGEFGTETRVRDNG